MSRERRTTPRTTRRPGRRESDPPGAVVEIDAKTILELARRYFSSGGSMVKLAIAVGATILAIWGAFSFDDRLETTETALDVVEADVITIETELDNVADDLRDLQDGIGEAADDLEGINKLLRDLQGIREDLIRIVKQKNAR